MQEGDGKKKVEWMERWKTRNCGSRSAFPGGTEEGPPTPRMAEVDPSPRIVVVYWTVLAVFFWTVLFFTLIVYEVSKVTQH